MRSLDNDWTLEGAGSFSREELRGKLTQTVMLALYKAYESKDPEQIRVADEGAGNLLPMMKCVEC